MWNKYVDVSYSAQHKEIESNNRVRKFNVGGKVKITKCKNIFSKSYTENWSRELHTIDSVLNANPWTCTIKDLNGEQISGSFYGEKL